MQDASLTHHVKVTYLAGLLQRHCDLLLLAIGDAQIHAAEQAAANNPSTKIIIIGAGTSGSNLTAIPVNSRDQVRHSVAAAIDAASGSG